ncbi:MAG: hypothetical protein PF693_00110 [Spirochaetia bacterium]|nr:hypothetical protein [Spirochaetia bacterium]
MNTEIMTISEIRKEGLQALTQKLGAVGMVGFFQQNESGWGNYTKDRSQWLGTPSFVEIADGIRSGKGN